MNVGVRQRIFKPTFLSTFNYYHPGTTRRTASNPAGDETVPSVKVANMITSRSVLLILLAIARGVHFVVEQPKSSLMDVYHRMHHVFQLADAEGIQIFRSSLWTGLYFHFAPKPTKLWGTACCPYSLMSRINVPMFMLAIGLMIISKSLVINEL